MVNQRLEAIEHHMAGFHITVSHHQEEIAGLKLRLERLEKRLEIRDT
jgi:archaellum component FlaC